MKLSAAPAMELMVLSVGFSFADYYPRAMIVSLIIVALLGWIYWIKGYRRMGMGVDVPITGIASAAQGYVGLRGRVKAGKNLLYTPISSRACVWYRYSETAISLRWSDNWWNRFLLSYISGLKLDRWWYHFPHSSASTLKEGQSPPAQRESENYFYIEDSGGKCLINPRLGEFSVVKRDVVYGGRLTYIEQWLPESAWVTVFGDFRTLDGATVLNQETKNVILRWRDDWGMLLDRFDTNKDGTLDQAEWEKVRQEAANEARKSVNIPRHTLSATDEKPLYIFEGRPEEMNRSYSWWASAQFMVFVGSSIALATASWWLSTVVRLSAWVNKFL